MEWKQEHIDIWTGLKLSQAFLVGGGGEGEDKDLASIAKVTGLCVVLADVVREV